MLKKYTTFLKEASIEDNPAVPGGYKSGIEREEQQRMGVRQGDRGQEMQVGGQLMQDLRRSQQLTSGKEEELSKLATDLISSIYLLPCIIIMDENNYIVVIFHFA